jgi:hypothetical protein
MHPPKSTEQTPKIRDRKEIKRELRKEAKGSKTTAKK